jgi:hypothetical protein
MPPPTRAHGPQVAVQHGSNATASVREARHRDLRRMCRNSHLTTHLHSVPEQCNLTAIELLQESERTRHYGTLRALKRAMETAGNHVDWCDGVVRRVRPGLVRRNGDLHEETKDA